MVQRGYYDRKKVLHSQQSTEVLSMQDVRSISRDGRGWHSSHVARSGPQPQCGRGPSFKRADRLYASAF